MREKTLTCNERLKAQQPRKKKIERAKVNLYLQKKDRQHLFLKEKDPADGPKLLPRSRKKLMTAQSLFLMKIKDRLLKKKQHLWHLNLAMMKNFLTTGC